MFPTRYFPNRYFAPRYWPKVGSTVIATPRLLYYLARRDTTLAKPAQNNTTQNYLARRDTTGAYSGSES